MSQQLKTAFIGTLGLATLIICIYAFSRKSKSSGGSSEGKSATLSSSSKKKDDVDLSSDQSSSEAPVKTSERGLDIGGDVAKGEVEAKEGDQEPEDGETLVARFNKANSMAKKYFKAQRYELAAEHYGVALSLCDKLPNHGDKRTALHNNRGAALEKAGKYESSLEECSMCLERDPTHPLARVRKSRVLEAMGKPVEALAEVCAHVLLERDRFEARAMLNPVATFTPPNPPPNLEGLLSKVAKSRAEEHLAKKEQEAAKEAKDVGGKPKPKPLGKNVVTELLRSFGSFSEIERRYKGMKETALTRKLESVEGQAGGDEKAVLPVLEHASGDRVSILLDRAMVRLVKKKYEEAREDIFEAVEILTQLQKTAGNEGIGIPGDVQAAVWEWKGTFLQLVTELDSAMEAYENACLVLEEEGKPASADLLIKMAYLFLDKDNRDEAKKYFERAEEQFPKYGSVYAHMSRLGMSEGGNSPEVIGLLEKAVELNKTDVYSWESLAKVYVQNGNMTKAWATTAEALKFVPKAEALLLLKAELKFSMAVNAGDASAGPEIMDMFDEAIREHPISATLYISKSAFLVQMVNDVSGAVEALETAIAVEPTSVGAWVQLANLKVLIAKSTQEVQDVTVLLQKAIDICTTDQDVVDTFSVLVATEGRINGAALLGRSSFT